MTSLPARTFRAVSRALALATIALCLALAGCTSLEFEPVPDAQVDQARKAKAEEFGSKMLRSWAKDEYPALGEEATAALKSGLAEEGQKKADKGLEEAIGSFQSMVLVQTQRSKPQPGKPSEYEVYRFKAVFDKSAEPAEVRVVLDSAGKVSGFWVKPWKDALQ